MEANDGGENLENDVGIVRGRHGGSKEGRSANVMHNWAQGHD